MISSGTISEVRLKLDEFISKYLNNLFLKVNNRELTEDKQREILNLIREIMTEVIRLEKKYSLFIPDIFSGAFSFKENIKLPMYVIMDYLHLLTRQLEKQEFSEELKALTNRMRRVKMPPNFKNNWNLAFLLTGVDEIYLKKEEKVTIDGKKYNSSLRTYNSLLAKFDKTFGDTISSADEALLEDNTELYPELIIEPIWVANLGNAEVILFKEQSEELWNDYTKLSDAIIKRKVAEKKAVLMEHIMPYFKNKSLEELILIDMFTSPVSDTAKLMGQLLEKIYFAIKNTAGMFYLKVEDALNNFKVLESIDDYVRKFLNLESIEKERVIRSLLDIYESRPKIALRLLGIPVITSDELISKLNRLPLISLWECLEEVQSRTFGYQYLVRLLKEDKNC